MLTKSLLNFMFSGFSIQRWNDKIRPVALTEIDKHAHKMVISYCLGKKEICSSECWDKIIRNGIFEYFRRASISDINSPVFERIKAQNNMYAELNEKIWEFMEPKVQDLSSTFKDDLRTFLLQEQKEDLASRILDTAHIKATRWEFDKIIKQSDPNGFDIAEINENLKKKEEANAADDNITVKVEKFIDLCGRLRFQTRWGQATRLPKTSVLGHMFLVAAIAYILSGEVNEEHSFCHKRKFNNFFGGLFHDLPEAVTRDIVTPFKSQVPGMEKIIKGIEKDMLEDKILIYVEEDWKEEIKYFSVDEFRNKWKDMPCDYDEEDEDEDTNFYQKHNEDDQNPLDGSIIRVADYLAGYLEAYHSCNLLNHTSPEDHMLLGKMRYLEKLDKNVAGLKIRALRDEFLLEVPLKNGLT
jgi:5'-deoxynucleotidase YfbR-like HD superfamily hydrolase/competence protein ComGF